ncbi:ImmA/IrrE family metallo-endopeptidase [Leptospira kmetyi]|uniref:IrrE N-terminal-like domain-containing protein n=1 Tax=Leptospira kmetyi TaxID=408139 RepID=A0ABX4N9K1_9LEPT|nr:ImmA/IrrE family metallo-endopeptidase [Leptospira kmetyi]PJZ28782.1 hypothetical protein CH378_16435 [Leptospira kmetyi]PJZ39512.1 hypothetical protein CH370_20870 [Leptospira kmetyi]
MSQKISVPVVKGLSRAAISRQTELFLIRIQNSGFKIKYPLPVLDILEFGYLKKLFGYDWSTEELQDSLKGYTEFGKKKLVLSQATYEGASDGNPMDLFTVTHELGHVALHTDQIRARLYEKMEIVKMNRGSIKPYLDPEWQANEFAAALLMPQSRVVEIIQSNQVTPENIICEEFGVSDMAARFRIDNVSKEMKKNPSRNGGLFY